MLNVEVGRANIKKVYFDGLWHWEISWQNLCSMHWLRVNYFYYPYHFDSKSRLLYKPSGMT